MILFSASLLFVHNPKTAGTSLLSFLSDRLSGPVYRAGVRELGTHHPHLSQAKEYARRIAGFSDLGTQSRIIAVVREPLDRERSMYLYYRNVLSTSVALEADLPDPEMQRAVFQAAALSFSEWLDWQAGEFGHCDIWQSRRYYQTDDGEYPDQLVVLRFEHLEADLSLLMTRLELSPLGLPKLNTMERGNTDLGVREDQVEFVARSYAWMRQMPERVFVSSKPRDAR